MLMQKDRYLLPPGPLPLPMSNSDGTGLPLVKDGPFAADLIRFAPGKGVAEHTHPGAHILVVVSGRGTVTFEGTLCHLNPGTIYLVPAGARHAVHAAADEELTLISIANDHRPVDSPERLEVTHAQIR